MKIVIDLPEHIYKALIPDKKVTYSKNTIELLFLELQYRVRTGVLVEEEPGYYYPKEETNGED